MEENLAKKYYDALLVEQNPPSILTKMFCSYFEINYDVELVKVFAQLIKIYGREIAFHSTLEIFEWDNLDPAKPRGALFHIAKRLFDETHQFSESRDLTKDLQSFYNSVNKLRKPNTAKIENPFKEENDGNKPGIVSDGQRDSDPQHFTESASKDT